MTNSLLRLAPRGPTLLIIGVLAGFAVPALAEAARPAMAASIFVIVLGPLLRVNASDFMRTLRQPRFSALLPVVVMLVCPVLVGAAAHLAGIGPELALAMVLAVCAPPSGGTAAVARMLGLDATIPLAVTLLSMALAPLSVPLLAAWFAGIAFDPVELALRLFVLTAGAGYVALVLRKRAPGPLKRHADIIDGLVLAALLIFAISTMAGVRAQIEAEPMAALVCVTLAFACNLALQGLGVTLLPGTLAERLGIGLILGNRNVGLVWSALGASTSPTMALFFAATQFPIYMTPRLIACLIRWTTPETTTS
jgi:BASS family bile acid:Na+ symporter